MREKYIELVPYQEELWEDMPAPFFHLAEILKCGAFELCQADEKFLIPYMMNDALEYYLILEEASMTGEYLPETEIISAALSQNGEKYLLILRQEGGGVCTLHFSGIKESAQCYQYHRIGHFWVKGREQWRQLVYQIGTIYDKYEYFGERFCNQLERQLRELIRFAPFRFWSPVHESLKDRYPDSAEAAALMKELCREAGDFSYLCLTTVYQVLKFPFLERLLAEELTASRHKNLYRLIRSRVDEASLGYPERDYGVQMNGMIERERCAFETRMHGDGFCGKYPVFYKENREFAAMEEHPFTTLEMEWEDFGFRIRLMEVR